MSSLTSRIRNDHPKLIEQLKQNIELFHLWKNENFEDDISVSSYFTRKETSSKARSKDHSKDRFFSQFILQCIEDDIDVLMAAIKKDKQNDRDERAEFFMTNGCHNVGNNHP